MPQMAPINWLFLYLFFTLIFLLINSLTYFIYTPNFSSLKTSKTLKINFMNWKW